MKTIRLSLGMLLLAVLAHQRGECMLPIPSPARHCSLRAVCYITRTPANKCLMKCKIETKSQQVLRTKDPLLVEITTEYLILTIHLFACLRFFFPSKLLTFFSLVIFVITIITFVSVLTGN